jgi:hypothetical protein
LRANQYVPSGRRIIAAVKKRSLDITLLGLARTGWEGNESKEDDTGVRVWDGGFSMVR